MRLIDESLWNAAIYAVEYLNDTSLLRKLISEAEEPTIEAEPVRHGRWVIEGNEYGNMAVSCTSCDYVRHIYGWGLPALKRELKENYIYCNKCGAKMEGDQ